MGGFKFSLPWRSKDEKEASASASSAPAPAPSPSPSSLSSLVRAPQPVPPSSWVDPSALPPGMIINTTLPTYFPTFISTPRAPGEAPYERLIVVSSRVRDPMAVARSALPHVAVIAYDWKRWKLHELLGNVRLVLGGNKVASIAVVAPGTRAGNVGILEGWATHWELLETKRELREFWKGLAGFVAVNANGDGGRVDLLGCRLEEGGGAEGAALLKELFKHTKVPFACSDDISNGYQLCTFSQHPASRKLSLASSSVQALDLYCDRAVLFGQASSPSPLARYPSQGDNLAALAMNLALHTTAPSSSSLPKVPSGSNLQRPPSSNSLHKTPSSNSLHASRAADGSEPSLPRSGSPGSEIVPSDEQPSPSSGGGKAGKGMRRSGSGLMRSDSGMHRTASKESLTADPSEDVYARIVRYVRDLDIDLAAAFKANDKAGKGAMTVEEMVALVREVTGDATELEAQHVKVMADIGGVTELAYSDFRDGLDLHRRIHAAVRRYKDPSEIMQRLFDYLFDNHQVLRTLFADMDSNADGLLSHTELQKFVALIPGLEPNEQKFIMAALYQSDKASDGTMDFDTLLRHVKQFNTKARQVARDREARSREYREESNYRESRDGAKEAYRSSSDDRSHRRTSSGGGGSREYREYRDSRDSRDYRSSRGGRDYDRYYR